MRAGRWEPLNGPLRWRSDCVLISTAFAAAPVFRKGQAYSRRAFPEMDP